MTDKVQPKGRKGAKKAKAEKKLAGPKLAAKDIKPGIGHNSGQVIPELVKIVDEILASAERQKTEAKLQRDLRNRAKTEFGVLSGPLAHELRLRKMDTDVRVQFESSHADLKHALGYQPSLDFQGGVATNASVKAQPPEAKMAKQQHHPKAEPQHGAEQGFEVEGDEAESGEEMPPLPDNLRRGKDVIEREG